MPTAEEIREEQRKRRILAKFRFKCLVKQVMFNRVWLSELEDTKLGDNVKRNIAIIVRRKGLKGLLSLTEKRILNSPQSWRTPEETKLISDVIMNLLCFRDFSPKTRCELGKTMLHFQFFRKGRTILKQNHHAAGCYFILDGEILVYKKRWDAKLKETVDFPVGTLGPGMMFGETALLFNCKRTASCVSAFDVELLCIYRDDFNRLLKKPLQEKWDNLMMALDRFEYFTNWNEDQLRECFVLSRFEQYDPQQIVYNEELNYVYFVLSGQCTILQCLKMHKLETNGKTEYKLVDIEKEKEEEENCRTLKKMILKNLKMKLRNPGMEPEDPDGNIECKSSSTGSNIVHRFVNVCSLSTGSVFGLGENMDHRTIIARNRVQCLLIPRNWLFQKSQNFGNIFHRIKMFLNASIPSREKLYIDFLSTIDWMQYRRKIVKEIADVKENRSNATRLRDVPMICRIEEDL